MAQSRETLKVQRSSQNAAKLRQPLRLVKARINLRTDRCVVASAFGTPIYNLKKSSPEFLHPSGSLEANKINRGSAKRSWNDLEALLLRPRQVGPAKACRYAGLCAVGGGSKSTETNQKRGPTRSLWIWSILVHAKVAYGLPYTNPKEGD